MEVVRCAKSLDEIREGRVRVRRLLTRGNGGTGFAGFDASVVKELVAGPKREWLERSEIFATEIYPQWREHFQETGRRLPDEVRKRLDSRLAWDAEKVKFGQTILSWLGTSTEPECVAEITRRLDAVLDFTIFVAREFLTRDYSPQKHLSDVYDQFQLHYLAVDKFVIVSEDSDLSNRTSSSCQAERIMSFGEFLQSL
jgi:hypothetical protein